MAASASTSSVAAALAMVVAESEEPAVKRAHTVNAEMEEKMGKMGDQNKALFEALSLVIDSKLDNRMKKMDAALGAVALATDKGFQELKKDLHEEKEARKSSEVDFLKKLEEMQVHVQPASPVITRTAAPQARARSVGARSHFVPKKVFVQGFYDFEANTGALKPQDRDNLANRLVENMSEGLRGKFALEKKYAMSRRLVFTSANGGEECWEFREKLVEAIEAKNIEVGGKPVKVRVEEEPERQLKRQHYWKAVDALKAVAKEGEQFILEPVSFGIFDAKDVDRLGVATADSYEWNTELLGRNLPMVDVAALKKATIQRRGRQ